QRLGHDRFSLARVMGLSQIFDQVGVNIELDPGPTLLPGTDPMSALGQKRTLELAGSGGFLPPQAARSTRVSISLRSIPKSIGLVKSASAPPSNALRLVSASP